MNFKNVISKIWNYRDYVLIAATAVAVYFAFQKPKQVPPIITTNPAQLHAVDSIRDINNKLYAKVAQQTLEASIAKEYTDSIEKALRLSKSSVKKVDVYVSKDSIVYIDTSTKAVYAKGDTLKVAPVAYSAHFKDAWVDIKAIAGKDTGLITFSDVDTVTRVEVVNNHLFRPSEHVVFLGNSNPHNKIEEGTSFTIKEKKAVLVIGPSLSYDPLGGKILVGISAVYPIFTIKK